MSAKKILIILSLAIIVIIGMMSCKATNDCPAYGQVQNTAQGQTV